MAANFYDKEIKKLVRQQYDKSLNSYLFKLCRKEVADKLYLFLKIKYFPYMMRFFI